jgi:hypothetical protein
MPQSTSTNISWIERLVASLTALILVSTLTGCSEDQAAGPSYPTGTMVGRVLLYDTLGMNLPASGVTVTIEGTGLTTTTDERGEWSIPNVPTRTYDVRFDKPGYGYSKQTSVVFVGGGVVRINQVTLYPIPKCSAFLDAFRQIDTNRFEMYAHASCSNSMMFGGDVIVFFISNSRDVSFERGKYKAQIAAQSHIPMGSAGGMYDLKQYELNFNDSIYVAAYHAGGGSGYYDAVTGEYIYTALNPERSNVRAVLPQ